MATKPLKYWSLTIDHLEEHPHTVDRVKQVFIEFCQQWVFQLERGEIAGKLHYQCRLHMDPPQSKATLLHLMEMRCFERIQCTFAPESNNSINQGGLSFYVMKDDSREDGPWADPSFHPKKRKLYTGKDLECMKTPLAWQAQVLAMLKEAPDDRSLIWIADTQGNHGKSKLMKWMKFSKELDCARVPMGTATQIKTSVIEKGAHTIYMVDLPRTVGKEERIQEIYSALEEVKNGWVESAMYGKNQELLMDPPHVIIFSNYYPQIAHMSTDRWRVYKLDTIEGETTMSLVSMAEMEAWKNFWNEDPKTRSPQV